MITALNGRTSGFDIAAFKQKQQQIFNAIDTNGDGKIDKSELEAIQKSRQANGAQPLRSVDQIFQKLDGNSDGAITLQEADAGLAKIAQHAQLRAPSFELSPPFSLLAATGDEDATTASTDAAPVDPGRSARIAALRSYAPWRSRSRAQTESATESTAQEVAG